jgi:hypothetical protein
MPYPARAQKKVLERSELYCAIAQTFVGEEAQFDRRDVRINYAVCINDLISLK